MPLLLAVVLSTAAGAQTIGQNGSADKDKAFTLSIRSQLVSETVTVRDKAGNPLSGLTADDFSLTEDGITQKIRFCEHQKFPVAATAMPTLTADQENITIYKSLGRSKIAQESSEELRYSGHRLFALYFDISAMGIADRYRAIDAAETFVRTQMTPVDLSRHSPLQRGTRRCPTGFHCRPPPLA